LGVVLCGTYGDLQSFRRILKQLRQDYGQGNVFPNDEHLKRSSPCIRAHHGRERETPETIALRSELMKAYFDHIDHAELVVIVNEKKGREYYGIGTMIELGYALAAHKRIAFTRRPRNSNIRSLMLSDKRNIGLLEQGKRSSRRRAYPSGARSCMAVPSSGQNSSLL